MPWSSPTAGWATASSSDARRSSAFAARKRKRRIRSSGCRPSGLRFLGFPDCSLNPYRGRHFATIDEPTEIDGGGGLQNAFTHALRQIRPNRVFLPTSADLHPDHRIVHEEVLISLFHAQGNIWPELGEPITEVPKVYEFACYCDFPEPPRIRIDATPAMLETKLDAIRAFASQEQIELVVAIQRNVGAIEYLRDLAFRFYCPNNTTRCLQSNRTSAQKMILFHGRYLATTLTNHSSTRDGSETSRPPSFVARCLSLLTLRMQSDAFTLPFTREEPSYHASRQRHHRTKRRTDQRHQRQPLRDHPGMPRRKRRSARRWECGSASKGSCRAT